jgi:predicted O-methyltransferase YrrM
MIGSIRRNFGLLRRLWRERDGFGAYLARKEAYDKEGMFYGGIREDEMDLLRELVNEAAELEGPIIEIGTLFGLTTVVMAAQKRPDQLIVTVDNYGWNPWGLSPVEHRQFAERILYNLRESGDVELIVSDKVDYYKQYAGPRPSLVFLDADHRLEPTREDIAWARSIDSQIVAGHDYSGEFPGVQQAVDELGGPERLLGTLWCLGGNQNQRQDS